MEEYTFENYNQNVKNAKIHYNYDPNTIPVIGKYQEKITITKTVDKTGDADILISFADDTVTADDILIFATGFVVDGLSAVVDFEKSLVENGVSYSGSVLNYYKLFIWDKNQSPISEATPLNF